MAEERKLYFNVSARTAKLIGQENFANAEGAIIELVKNSYDADANFCAVIFDIKANSKESSVYIIDSGCGMDDAIIEHQWMTIGTDDKLINSRSLSTGRVKSGAKGIGRFALNRLGLNSEMLTFPKGAQIGYDWTIDWSEFDKMGSTLADVAATIKKITIADLHSKAELYGLNKIDAIREVISSDNFHGTVLKVTNLNDNWDDSALQQLNSNLEILIPSHLATNFDLYMFTLEDLSQYGKVNSAEYEDYDYKIEAKYEGNSSRTISVRMMRRELNVSLLETSYQGAFDLPIMKSYPYRLIDFLAPNVETTIHINESISQESLNKIGGFSFVFYFIKNTIKDDSDSNATKKYPYNNIESSVRKIWLKKFSGVRIYRDDFRVRPYGEPGNDWLRLGERQSQSPGGAGQKMGGYRIRPNQISGSVFISRLENKMFDDKSSREGIMENEEFSIFQNLLKLIIEAFERDRNTIMYSLSQHYHNTHRDEGKAKNLSDEVKKEKEGNQEKSKFSENEKILAEGYASLEDTISEKDTEIRMLRSLASSGIAVASFTHELQSLSKILLPRTELLRGAMRAFIDEEDAKKLGKFNDPYYLLSLIRENDIKLQQWLNYSLNAIRRNKRDRKDIILANYFENYKSSWLESLKQKNIIFEVNCTSADSDAVFWGYEMDLDSIFNNFISNSVSSLLRTEEVQKHIWLNWRKSEEFVIIDFIDNGLGLVEEYRNNPEVIFEAFETSSIDKNGDKTGTGMGLFIVKGIIDSYEDALVSILPTQSGFGMEIRLKLKKHE